MATIHCTNLDCQAEIDVPTGTLSVICPTCNTWQFIADNDVQGGNFSPEPAKDYFSPNSFSTEEEIPGTLPVYESYELPVDTGSPGVMHPSVDPPLPETTSPGYLITEEGIRYSLKEGKNLIGRKGCDVQIENPTVSRRHCFIEVEANPSGKGWFYTIYDIGHIEGNASTNGVFISGRSLRLQNHERIPIGKETVIRLGGVNLTLKY